MVVYGFRRDEFELFPRVGVHRSSGQVHGQISGADICIDDNRGVTCILCRLLMGEICCAIAFGRFCRFEISQNSVSTELGLRPWEPDTATMKYPSQLFRPGSGLKTFALRHGGTGILIDGGFDKSMGPFPVRVE